MAWNTKNVPARPRVEQATQAPGEMREARRCQYRARFVDAQCVLSEGHEGPHTFRGTFDQMVAA